MQFPPTQYRWPGVHPAGVVLAVLAAVWHAVLMSRATNDNFLHMTLAQQWLAGDWPVRDFFEHGWVLQYSLSAAAQLVFGNRLLAEAVIVGAAWAVSTYLVFQLVRRLTGSTWAAVLSALLLIVAGARGYSYPKGIVYAVAAVLWWDYLHRPTMARIVGFGIWVALAYYWRPDHGVYVASALVVAVVLAHGLRAASLTRCALAGATTLTLVVPFWLYVQATVGLPEYVQTGWVWARVEHETHGSHEWPLVRLRGTIVEIEPADAYAPIVGIRWSPESSDEMREQILSRYGLTPVTSEDDTVRVRLSERSLPNIRALINEPIVSDTAGIERSTATLSSWSTWRRWRFEHAWLRVRVLPHLDARDRAVEFTVTAFYLLPIVLLGAAAWLARRLSPVATAPRLMAFAGLAFLVDAAMLRRPFAARAPDAVVLSAVVFGVCVGAMWQAAPSLGRLRKALLRTCAAACAAIVLTIVAGAGQFGDSVGGLAGQWTSFRRARAAWGEIYAELGASPPLRYYRDRSARFSLRLAAYARECVPPSDRLLVLWFEPEIFYYAERLMAQRHMVFVADWADLAHEQHMTLEKITRYEPPLVFARQPALDDYARATYPEVVAYVEREYRLAATIADGGEQYLIFARRGRSPLRGFGPGDWPCFVRDTSEWARVGLQPE